MLKQPGPNPHKTTRTEITSLFGEAKLVLEEAPKAISPFGGLASFISFLGQIGFARQVRQQLPFAEPTSHNAIPLAHALTAFLMSVVVRAQRFAHTEWLRADRVLHALLGLERFPSDDTVRNFFLRFSQAHLEAFCREGKQEGARGSIPGARGVTVLIPCWRCWRRHRLFCTAGCESGNTGAAREGLVALAVQIVGAILSYAHNKGDKRLEKKAGISATALGKAKDSKVVALCRGIHRMAVPLAQALKPSKITAEMIASLKTQTDDYKKSYTNPHQAIATGKAATEYLPVVLRETSSLLRKELDPLMVQFKATEPEFYARYKAARRIVKPAVNADKKKARNTTTIANVPKAA